VVVIERNSERYDVVTSKGVEHHCGIPAGPNVTCLSVADVYGKTMLGRSTGKWIDTHAKALRDVTPFEDWPRLMQIAAEGIAKTPVGDWPLLGNSLIRNLATLLKSSGVTDDFLTMTYDSGHVPFVFTFAYMDAVQVHCLPLFKV